MTSFKIPVTFSMYGYVRVESDSVEKALKYAHENIDDLPLPDHPEYVESSYVIADGDLDNELQITQEINS